MKINKYLRFIFERRNPVTAFNVNGTSCKLTSVTTPTFGSFCQCNPSVKEIFCKTVFPESLSWRKTKKSGETGRYPLGCLEPGAFGP
ncbi:hypothetical protein CEXT_329311 [Caerostris extrusa]|uniref:Uncharacterized protein n=1 Tax=Caerostris extrusa TaxID=172846 RepID=A0AAV4Y5Z4_CAEEX|nr:hypothetical protein CEXT_329311 [Caerostris extrusa]